MFASTFLAESAAIWWYTLIQSNQGPASWEAFKIAIKTEFVPADHVRRARDKLKILKQRSSVVRYLSEFRNVILAILDVTKGEKFDKFVDGLKNTIRMEVLKSTVQSFEEATQMAVRIDSALERMSMDVPAQTPSGGVTQMEIGNMETTAGSDGSRKNAAARKQRQKDLENNACFVCHKTGCRSYKHKGRASVNNVEVDSKEVESSSISHTSQTTAGSNDERQFPISPLLVMNGRIIGQSVTVLKDDGCNSNVISSNFVRKHASRLAIKKASFQILHSKHDTMEQASRVVLNATVHLGMPWHVAMQPIVNYNTRRVSVAGESLPVRCVPDNCAIRVTNLAVKKFRSMLRRRSKESYQVYRMSPVHVNQLISASDPIERKVELSGADACKLHELLAKYNEVFRDELPSGLPPSRGGDHAIEIEGNHKPPYHSLYQLSPAELVAMKAYIVGLLKTGKFRPSKSPYGAPLFFVKHKEGLRGVVDYRALNRITKRNRAPIPRIDEIFDRVGGSRVSLVWISKRGAIKFECGPMISRKRLLTPSMGNMN
eukprot:IDg5965t1